MSRAGLAVPSQTVATQRGVLEGIPLGGKDPESMYEYTKTQPLTVAVWAR